MLLTSISTKDIKVRCCLCVFRFVKSLADVLYTFKCCQELKSSVFFLLKASKTAQIAKDYGLEQAALTGYGQAKNGFDVANR